jgi:hypothetical protein
MAWMGLRVAVPTAAALGVLFWIGSLIHCWRMPLNHRDGLKLPGPVLATAYLVALVLPTLLLGLLGRWLAAPPYWRSCA